MGGQACVFYGAAEFSSDTDLAILADTPNLSRLRAALSDLQAEVSAVCTPGLAIARAWNVGFGTRRIVNARQIAFAGRLCAGNWKRFATDGGGDERHGPIEDRQIKDLYDHSRSRS